MAVASCFAFSLLVALGSVEAHAGTWDDGRLQLQLVPGADIEEVNATYSTYTIDSLEPLYLIGLPAGSDEHTYLAMINNDPRVEWAEYAYVNETPEAVRQMVVAIVGNTVEGFLDQGVYDRLRLAHIHLHTTGENASIAFLDTGVNVEHPAFADIDFAPGIDYVDNDLDPADTGNGVDDDGDGLIDEGMGHGTMVTGIATLVAPGARVLPIRVLDDEGRGTTFAVAKGLRYAVEQGVDVINLSLGLLDDCNVLRYEIDAAVEAGVVIAAAAGNEGIEDFALFPARLDEVVCVTALDSVDVKADFSNYDPIVATSAPGVGILAPFGTGEYAVGAGTSFATPFISGQVALVRAVDPYLGKIQTESVIAQGVVDIYDLEGNVPYQGMLGTGRIDGLKTWTASSPAADVPTSPVASGGLVAYPNPSRAGEMVRIEWAGSAGATSPAGRSPAKGTPPDGGHAARDSSPFPSNGMIRALIVDAGGRVVRSLAAGAGGGDAATGDVQSGSIPASWELRWDGRDRSGRPLPAGTYFVRIQSGNAADAVRIVKIGR